MRVLNGTLIPWLGVSATENGKTKSLFAEYQSYDFVAVSRINYWVCCSSKNADNYALNINDQTGKI